MDGCRLVDGNDQLLAEWIGQIRIIIANFLAYNPCFQIRRIVVDEEAAVFSELGV
jgi:hypothetical protein